MSIDTSPETPRWIVADTLFVDLGKGQSVTVGELEEDDTPYYTQLTDASFTRRAIDEERGIGQEVVALLRTPFGSIINLVRVSERDHTGRWDDAGYIITDATEEPAGDANILGAVPNLSREPLVIGFGDGLGTLEMGIDQLRDRWHITQSGYFPSANTSHILVPTFTERATTEMVPDELWLPNSAAAAAALGISAPRPNPGQTTA